MRAIGGRRREIIAVFSGWKMGQHPKWQPGNKKEGTSIWALGDVNLSTGKKKMDESGDRGSLTGSPPAGICHSTHADPV